MGVHNRVSTSLCDKASAKPSRYCTFKLTVARSFLSLYVFKQDAVHPPLALTLHEQLENNFPLNGQLYTSVHTHLSTLQGEAKILLLLLSSRSPVNGLSIRAVFARRWHPFEKQT